MAKISANYEVVYIIDPAQSEEAIAATVAKFQTLAEQNGSDVVVDEWGKRQSCLRHRLQDRRLLCADDLHQRARNSPRNWIVSWALPRASCVP